MATTSEIRAVPLRHAKRVCDQRTYLNLVLNLELDLNLNLTVRPGERFKDSEDGVDLSNAEVIVSIGRGVGKVEYIDMVKSLAEKLNAQIGASRPVVDAGWLDHSYQIGSSGQTVSPKLYFSVGISGAIQHLAGVNSSKNIVVINTDPEAPFFKAADYGIVGDAFEVVPKLIEAIKTHKSNN